MRISLFLWEKHMMSENVMPMCCNTGWGNGLGAGVGGFLGAALGTRAGNNNNNRPC